MSRLFYEGEPADRLAVDTTDVELGEEQILTEPLLILDHPAQRVLMDRASREAVRGVIDYAKEFWSETEDQQKLRAANYFYLYMVSLVEEPLTPAGKSRVHRFASDVIEQLWNYPLDSIPEPQPTAPQPPPSRWQKFKNSLKRKS